MYLPTSSCDSFFILKTKLCPSSLTLYEQFPITFFPPLSHARFRRSVLFDNKQRMLIGCPKTPLCCFSLQIYEHFEPKRQKFRILPLLKKTCFFFEHEKTTYTRHIREIKDTNFATPECFLKVAVKEQNRK